MFTASKIDKNVPVPLYYQLKKLIMNNISQGILKPGDMLPAELELTEILQLSRTTVRQAIIELVNEGHLYRVKGKGTFISQPKIEQEFVARIEPFRDQMLRKGYTSKTIILEKKILNASKDVAEALNIQEHDVVIKLKRLRFADDTPIVIVDTYLNGKYCHQIYDVYQKEHSLYDLLSTNRETKITHMKRAIEASVSGEYESKHLCIPKGFPLQIFNSIGLNHLGTPIEYSIAAYRGDRSKFIVNISM
ncbi:GntR family transcriptional regulator [Clostridiaceae bacterium M8S5]|nr:GntR family transcriptional regulator [Clostridiaceae bacterium M8S5]